MNKEKGYTSHDVVAKMRGILKMKKIGHTGTLDPDACGVLPICLGKATKVVDLIVNKDKTYEAILKLGLTTDTQDMTGQVITSCPVNVSLSQIEDAISNFVGGYDQIPPMYSALKVNGKKLYELARQGKEIERKPRRIHIHDINLLDCNLDENEVKIRVSCGKGTYIRTLIHDIGKLLGCGATMKSLVRTAVGEFDIDNALSLNQVEEYKLDGSLYNYVISVSSKSNSDYTLLKNVNNSGFFLHAAGRTIISTGALYAPNSSYRIILSGSKNLSYYATSDAYGKLQLVLEAGDYTVLIQ